MSLDDIRGAIVARLAGIQGIGIVHPFQCHAVAQSDFRRFYETDGKVLGWFVHRVSTAEREDTNTWNKVTHRWRIEGVMSLDDEAESEVAFDRLIEAVRDAFRHDETLGGVVETTMSDGRAGPQLDDSGPAMFAGVLCHHARLTLSTVVGAPTGTEVIADFATGSLTWDRTPADGATDAEDTINPETEQ